MARYTSEALVRERLKSLGTAVIGTGQAAGTLDIEHTIEQAESYVLDLLPERYKQVAKGNVYGEIVVWDALSTTTSFTTKFYPVSSTANHYIWKNPGQGVDFHLDHINAEDNDSILTETTDYTITDATGAVTGLTLSKGWRLVMSYRYSGWSLFQPASPTTYYNVPRGLTEICTDAACYFTLLALYNIGRQDFLLDADNLANFKAAVDGALKAIKDGDRSFSEYDDIDFYEDWQTGDVQGAALPFSLKWGRG